MTKADRIRKLYADGFLTVKEIAALVGCRPEYVRVCARQRIGGAPGKADENFRHRRMKGKDLEIARSAGRAAYRAARDDGASYSKANSAYGKAWAAAMGLSNG